MISSESWSATIASIRSNERVKTKRGAIGRWLTAHPMPGRPLTELPASAAWHSQPSPADGASQATPLRCLARAVHIDAFVCYLCTPMSLVSHRSRSLHTSPFSDRHGAPAHLFGFTALLASFSCSSNAGGHSQQSSGYDAGFSKSYRRYNWRCPRLGHTCALIMRREDA